jgi:asparagine synthase (glutamine-hydrolysing)
VEQINKIIANKAEMPGTHQWLVQHLQDELKQRIENQPTIPAKKIRLPGQLREISLLQNAFFLKNHQVRERYAATFGIETRRPYWNKAMVQLSLMLPKRLKYRQGLNKYVHRQALQELLPEKVLTRTTKAEFSVTFDYYTKNLRSALTGDIPPKRHAWVHQSLVNQYFDVYDRGLEHDEPPWALWNLLFCDVIFTSESSDTMNCNPPLT